MYEGTNLVILLKFSIDFGLWGTNLKKAKQFFLKCFTISRQLGQILTLYTVYSN